MYTSTYTKFYKIHHLFTLDLSQKAEKRFTISLRQNKVGTKVTYLNIMKVIDDKPIIIIILKGEKLKASLLRSETRQRYSLSPLLFNTVLEVLAREIR